MGETVQVDAQGRWLEGKINSSSLAEAQRIWGLADPNYTPIDWHIDFKSGYRWLERTWYKDIKYGHKLGVDVKVPWELARMQHLPRMALTFLSLPEGSGERKVLQSEFRNQILDFIATNPPRFGVNWACPMDVAIRAANCLLAYNLFSSGQARVDDEFEAIFVRSIYNHGHHILNNLECGEQRGNHYLADIVGLAFIAAYLPSTADTDAWLAFAVQELITEVKHQFYPDGGNFEGSTAYHRLSAEMVYFATALILGLPQERQEKLKRYDHKVFKTGWGKPALKPAPLPFYSLPARSTTSMNNSPFPAWYFERMERMAEFIMDITKPGGHIPQIGDNDSGHFFKLGPKYVPMTVKQARGKYANLDGYSELPDDADYYMEDHLDCSHIVAAAYGLFGRDDCARWLGGKDQASRMPDCFCTVALSGGTVIGSQRFTQHQKQDNIFYATGIKDEFQRTLSGMHAKPKEKVRITKFPVQKGGLHEGLTLRAYPDFGLYLFTSPRFYLAVRCWPARKPFHSSHMHDDQLSIELVIDGRELVTDPGTYLYTPLPSARIRYRSVQAHFSPLPITDTLGGDETNVFETLKSQPAQVKYFGSIGFWGSTAKNDNAFNLAVLIQNTTVCVYHSSDGLKLDQRVHDFDVPTSPGYGVKLR